MNDIGNFIAVVLLLFGIGIIGVIYGGKLGYTTGYKAGCLDGSNKIYNVITIEDQLKCMPIEKIKSLK